MKEGVERINYLEFSSIGIMPPKKIFKHDYTKINAEVFPQQTVGFGFCYWLIKKLLSYSGVGSRLKGSPEIWLL